MMTYGIYRRRRVGAECLWTLDTEVLSKLEAFETYADLVTKYPAYHWKLQRRDANRTVILRHRPKHNSAL